MHHRSQLFDYQVDFFDLNDLSCIKKGMHILNFNMEQLVLAETDEEFKKIAQDANLIIADGVSVVLLMKFLQFFASSETQSGPIFKLAGCDLAQALIDKYSKIAILGASEKDIDILKNRLKEKIVFAHHGYFEIDQRDEIAEQIFASKAEILLVGMGSPRQEKFIYDYREKFSSMISMGVGGTLKLLTGKDIRAPEWMIFLNLEWLFRIFQEPFRIFRFLYNVCRLLLLLISKLFVEG